MPDSPPSNRSVLLLGRSLFMAAVEASLGAEPGVAVRRLESWSPRLLSDATLPDAVIVDSITAYAEVIAALVAAFPFILVIELAPGDRNSSQAIVRYGERRTLASAHDLAGLIVNTGRTR